MLDRSKNFLKHEAEDEELYDSRELSDDYNKEITLHNQIHLGLGLSMIVDNINNIGVFILDNDYKYIMANESHRVFMKKLLGIDIEEGMNILNVLDKYYNNRTKESLISSIKKYMEFVLEGNKISKTEEMLIDNNKVEYFKLEAIPIKNNEGKITRVGVYALNITENMNMHKLLLKMKMDVNSENSYKLDLLKNIKHEVEAPISNIKESINTLAKSHLSKEQVQQLDIIESSINSLVKILDDILNKAAKKSSKFRGNINGISNDKKKNEDMSKKLRMVLENEECKANIPNNKNLKPSSSKEIKILVAEDNLVNQMVISELIKINGWNEKIVNNGKEVIEALKKDKYDLVLMDISMPIMDGIEATKLIKSKKEWANIPVVALTAYALVQDKDKLNKLGMDDYLLKPVDEKKLKSIISKYLELPYECLDKNDNYFDTKEYDEGFVRLEKMLDGNTELVVELGEKIIEMLSYKQLNNIMYLAESGNVSELRSEIHKLKGAVSNFKLIKIQEILNKIKERAICGDINEIYKLIDEIEKNMELFEERLTIYKYKSN